LDADSTAGRCGRPAPTTISGAPCWDSSWQAAQIAETSSGCTSCISSMNSAMPLADVGGQPGGVAEQLDQVDLHVAGVGPAPSPPARRCPAASGRAPWRPAGRRSANALSTPRTAPSTPVRVAVAGASSRSAMCSAEETGRRSDWSGRASILPVPQPRPIAAERSWLSSTVLPTPRSPVSTRRALRPAVAIRSRTTSNADSSRVAAGQLGRALAGAGGVRVPHGVHVEHRIVA
jgi:hypothetical protein